MGPLAVRPERQGEGIGTIIVGSAMEWLRSQRARTIGLETMPRTVENIGFYSRLGFLPGHLTVTLVGGTEEHAGSEAVRVGNLNESDRDALLAGCRERLGRSAPGYDFTREFELTHELGLGDAVVIESGDIRGFGLWHSAALIESRTPEELRLLKLFADTPDTFVRLIESIERRAIGEGLRRVAVRCQTGCPVAYATLVRRGYRVRWTDLRMTLDGYPEAEMENGEVLLSNWEI